MMNRPSGPVPAAYDYRVLADGLDHPEGVCWDPRRRVLWCGGEAGQVYSVDLEGRVRVVATIDRGALLGVALDGNGRLYLCDPGNHRVWRLEPETGEYEAFGDEIDFPNYGVFAPDGTYYVSDSGDLFEPTGSIYSVSPSGVTRREDVAPIGYANGLCVDEEALYWVASTDPAVWRRRWGADVPELVVTLHQCTPDGLALDEHGALYISCYQPNQLWRFVGGKLDLLFDDWSGEFVMAPTNIAFYGDDWDRVALASLGGQRLITLDLGVRGRPVEGPKI
ncbi:MAG: SMP-30/gluconolactonase/LRE family protein [Acidobacteria bacterium]|nr:SMP-30/gluconolactonase/LRE family protein [Acidobacteriota bacterium]